MKLLQFLAIVFLPIGILGCNPPDNPQPESNMATVDGVEITRFSTPNRDILYAEGDDGVYAMMAAAKPGNTGSGGTSNACFACRVQAIISCAKSVECEGKADCRTKMDACIERTCSTKCSVASGEFGFSTGTLIQ